MLSSIFIFAIVLSESWSIFPAPYGFSSPFLVFLGFVFVCTIVLHLVAESDQKTNKRSNVSQSKAYLNAENNHHETDVLGMTKTIDTDTSSFVKLSKAIKWNVVFLVFLLFFGFNLIYSNRPSNEPLYEPIQRCYYYDDIGSGGEDAGYCWPYFYHTPTQTYFIELPKMVDYKTNNGYSLSLTPSSTLKNRTVYE